MISAVPRLSNGMLAATSFLRLHLWRFDCIRIPHAAGGGLRVGRWAAAHVVRAVWHLISERAREWVRYWA